MSKILELIGVSIFIAAMLIIITIATVIIIVFSPYWYIGDLIASRREARRDLSNN
jgi:presenilin-like A22 family membrane protease